MEKLEFSCSGLERPCPTSWTTPGTWEGDPQLPLPKPGPGIYSELLLFIVVLSWEIPADSFPSPKHLPGLGFAAQPSPGHQGLCHPQSPQLCGPEVSKAFILDGSTIPVHTNPQSHPEPSQLMEISKVYMEEYLICSGRGEGSSEVLLNISLYSRKVHFLPEKVRYKLEQREEGAGGVATGIPGHSDHGHPWAQ